MLNRIKIFITYLGIRILTLDYLLIKKLIKKYYSKKIPSVLDLGCGIGHLSHLFNKKGYLGIDLDPKLIATAKRNNPGYSFTTADATRFRSRRKFEFIVIIGVLHHLSNRGMNRAIATLKALLSKEGRAIIIEAIPPIWKYNFIGRLLRSMDQGDYVRKSKAYERSLKKRFTITESHEAPGGLVDYATFVVTH